MLLGGIAASLSRPLVRLVFRPEVRGLEHVPAGGCVVSANHLSGFDPWALAYVSIGSAQFAEAQGTAVKRLTLDGVEATTAAVANGTWPLMRPLNLVTKGEPSAAAKIRMRRPRWSLPGIWIFRSFPGASNFRFRVSQGTLPRPFAGCEKPL